MSDQATVYENKATYYNPASKKWDAGVFTLNKNHFQFVRENSINDQFHLYLPLSTISSLEKRQSSLIYAAIVITVGFEKHWFASFPNRDTVYNLLELFWREALLSRQHKTVLTPKTHKTSSMYAKELLGILYESESTLVGAANALADQGRQLQDSHCTVEDINTDLNVAEKIMKSVTFSGATLKISDSHLKNVTSSEEPDSRMKRYKVMFSFSKSSCDGGNLEKGTLRIGEDILLSDDQDNNRMQVTPNELESFQVISPWELCITFLRNGISEPCYLTCPQLSRLLKFVSSIPFFKHKIIYGDDDTSVYDTASCSSASSCGSVLNSPSPVEKLTKSLLSNSSDEQIQIDSAELSEKDMQEITSVLTNLQALAVEVGKEQQNQMEKINNLLSDVEKTELRIIADTKKIKKST